MSYYFMVFTYLKKKIKLGSRFRCCRHPGGPWTGIKPKSFEWWVRDPLEKSRNVIFFCCLHIWLINKIWLGSGAAGIQVDFFTGIKPISFEWQVRDQLIKQKFHILLLFTYLKKKNKIWLQVQVLQVYRCTLNR